MILLICVLSMSFAPSLFSVFSTGFDLAHLSFFLFFFNDTATTEIYTLSLHDALPIASSRSVLGRPASCRAWEGLTSCTRSEEHTSELQSPCNLVCRLLLEKKKHDVGLACTIKTKETQHFNLCKIKTDVAHRTGQVLVEVVVFDLNQYFFFFF